MKHFLFVRHGQTDLNAENKVIGGRSLPCPLNATGYKQANRCGVRLRAEGYQFHYVASSHAKRAQQTLDAILYGMPEYRAETTMFLVKHKLSTMLFTKDVDPVTLPDLVELDQGTWEGQLRSEVYTDKVKQQIISSNGSFRPPKGESMNDTGERMLKTLRAIEKALPVDGKALLVTHGVALKCLLREILDLDARTAYLMEIENTSLTEIVYTEKRFILRRLNDYAHTIDVPLLR